MIFAALIKQVEQWREEDLTGVVEADEPLIRQAIDAQRRYQAAQDTGLSAKKSSV